MKRFRSSVTFSNAVIYLIGCLQVDDLGEDCLISAAKTCMSSKLIGADSGNTHTHDKTTVKTIFLCILLVVSNTGSFLNIFFLLNGSDKKFWKKNVRYLCIMHPTSVVVPNTVPVH